MFYLPHSLPTPPQLLWFPFLLRATRGDRNPNLQVIITHTSHVCSQHVWTSIKNEWNAQNAILITRALTICHEKRTQSIAMEQKCFDLRSLSPALSNLWLLPVLFLFSLHHIDPTLTLHGPHIDPTFNLYFQHSFVNGETMFPLPPPTNFYCYPPTTTTTAFLLCSLHHHHHISVVSLHHHQRISIVFPN